MAEKKDETTSPERAAEQQDRSDWPRPGEEGYVHPDGTAQSERQLEDNRRAAADRAAAGSMVHGAPLATPGPTPGEETAKAVERAETYDGKTTAEAEEELAEFVEDKTAEKAEEAAAAADTGTRSRTRATRSTKSDK
ncbi:MULTISPECIES: hypothetical protein [unclassified Nonomuraea]|uniref:hypothetical protein n=1 Tax=unclassified Nonomuraea TaxID=2593643 RepID=UPI0033D91FB5